MKMPLQFMQFNYLLFSQDMIIPALEHGWSIIQQKFYGSVL